MKGSGDDDNNRLGEMQLFLALLSLVLFCCLKLGATDRRDKAIYIGMLCIECETKKKHKIEILRFQY